MKTILNFILGIFLGIITIRLGISAVRDLIALAIVPALIDALLTFGVGTLSLKCFSNI